MNSEDPDAGEVSWVEKKWLDDTRDKLKAGGQEHVMACVDEGIIDARKFINSPAAEYMGGLDVEHTNLLFKDSMAKDAEGVTYEPAPISGYPSTKTATTEETDAWSKAAFENYSAGKVGLLVLAGGQGTRLGFDRPKGEFVLELPGKKSIFQIFCERIKKLQMLSAAATGKEEAGIPFYVMTSEATHQQIVEYFEKNAYFGLQKGDVFFFSQGMLPCFSKEGKFLMDGDCAEKVALAPNGNGGIYEALHTVHGEGRAETAMQDMTTRGVEGLMVFAVDNAVCKVGDPNFVGYCMSEGADLGVKVVPKAGPDEKVGHLCTVGGKYMVIEYSEIGDLKDNKNEDGSLMYNAGSVCIHYYSRSFLETKCSVDALPTSYHVAKKSIPYTKVNVTDGAKPVAEKVKPEDVNGVKLEIFIFDVFPEADPAKVRVMESQRSEEFSPVKNASMKEGKKQNDSPETAKNIISDLHRGWLVAAGATVEGEGLVEVSPLVSYGGEGLDGLKGKKITVPAGGLLVDEASFKTLSQ